jgi:hypothetical protein
MRKFSPAYLLIIIFIFISSCKNSSRAITKENEKTFIDFFKFEPPSDVKDFDYFPDEQGIDAAYWISFTCNESTVAKIRERLELQPEDKAQEGLVGGLNIEPESWWDTAFIKKAHPYSWQKENLYRYLWYDKNKKKVYFLSFDT